MSSRYFRDDHLVLEDHADQIFAMTDEISGRLRKLGGKPYKSVDHIGRLQRQADYDAACTIPDDMLAELRENNQQLMDSLSEIRMLCTWYKDSATARLLEVWVDQVKRRIRSLSNATHVQ
jgi:starvation-inducible DNA-binding protein